MNILGFITGLLLIFAISSHTMWEKRIAQAKVDHSYQGYLQASRNVQNHFESKQFKKIKDVEKKKEDKTTSLTNNPNKEKKKKALSPSQECAKINIYPLFIEPKESQKELYSLMTKIIANQYGEKRFFQKKLSIKKPEEFILDKIIHAAKKEIKESKNAFYLEKLDLKDDSLQEVFYYMLKGTKGYSYKKPQGYPSLLNLVKAQQDPSHEKICLNCASYELLSVLFTATIADEIISLRSNEKLTSEGVEKLFSKHHFRPSTNIQNMLRIVHKKKKKNETMVLSGKDKETNISIERKFHLNG